MVVVSCCIVGCGRRRTADTEDEFFKFPTNKLQNKRWIDAIKLMKQPSTRAVVCSLHFVDSDYKMVRGQRLLKALAVPNAQMKFKKSTRSNTVLTSSEGSGSSDDEGSKSSSSEDAPLQQVRTTRNTRTSRRLNPSSKKDTSESSNDDRVSSKDKDDLENNGANSLGSKEDVRRDSINEDSASQNSIGNKSRNSIKTKKSKNTKKVSPNRDKDSPNRDKDTPSRGKESPSLDNKSPSLDNESPSQDKRSLSLDNKSPSQHKRSPGLDKRSKSQEIESIKDPKSVIEHLNSELEKQIEELDGSAQIIKNSGKLKMIGHIDDKRDNLNNGGSISSEKTGPASPDCVMMVEQVQVDIDPDTLMMLEEDEEEEVQLPAETVTIEDDKPADPVSLLTSSDEDDVILQEPKIDTVEVSDETDEEDLPLKKLAKKSKIEPQEVIDIFWSKRDHYCYHCGLLTEKSYDHEKHILTHKEVTDAVSQVAKSVVSNAVSNPVFICDVCSFQSSSKNTMVKHKKKHKDEKKYKCSFCEYRAKHRMSLVYHMKSHQNESLDVFKCQECGYGTAEAEEMHEHLKSHKQIRVIPGSKKKTMDSNKTIDSKKSIDSKKTSKKRRRDSSSGEEYVPK